MKKSQEWTHPFSRPLIAATIPGTGLEVKVTPDADERAAIAEALDLASVDRLTASLRLQPRAGGLIVVTGDLRADVQPICVVSLEPFPLAVAEQVEISFADAEAQPRRKPKAGEEEDVSGEDPPDIIENGIIDLGHVVTEFLSLAMPIYPRKPGADFDEPEPDVKKSPFDKLKALKSDE